MSVGLHFVVHDHGSNAAAAHQVIALQALNGRWADVTCNVGVIRGGTRPNVVAETVTLEVDLRSSTRADLEAAEREVRSIAAADHVPDVTTTIEEMGRHWPMEKLAGAAHLVDQAVELAVSGSASATPPQGVPRTPIRRPAWACRRSTAWAPSVATTTPLASTWRSTRSGPGRRCSRSCCWRSPVMPPLRNSTGDRGHRLDPKMTTR